MPLNLIAQLLTALHNDNTTLAAIGADPLIDKGTKQLIDDRIRVNKETIGFIKNEVAKMEVSNA